MLNKPPEPVCTLLKAIVLFTNQSKEYRDSQQLPGVQFLAFCGLAVQPGGSKQSVKLRWVTEQPAACTLPSMLTSLPPTRPPAASTEDTEYTEVYQEYTRSSHLSRFLAHAHTVCTRLSFPPTQLIKTGKERLGTRLIALLLTEHAR